jgi:HK97 family phage major capsid protein
MTTLRRTIHPEIRVLDYKSGIAEYIASDESLDSYNEIIRADGWRFNRFQKNAPFVDSHDYNTLGKLLGKVIDFKVRGSKLIETVQWAVDVAENQLAQLGWKMTAAGYLKAVSVGFYPVRSVSRWDSDQSGYITELARLGLKPESGARVIYIEQEQIELSACIIGANGNALAKARQAGVITDGNLHALATSFPDFVAEIERVLSPATSRHFSFAPQIKTTPTPSEPMSQTAFISRLAQITGGNSNLPAGHNLASPFNADGELPGLRTLCEAALLAAPELRVQISAAYKHAGGVNPENISNAEREIIRTVIAPGTSPGSGMVPTPVASLVLNLMNLYGAWQTLGVVPLDSGKSTLAEVSVEPYAAWITPANNGTAAMLPGSIVGAGIAAECPTIGALIEVANALIEDAKTTWEGALLEAMVNSLNKAADFACFAADGGDDATDGGQTGIFAHAGVTAKVAGAGNVSVATLDFQDFADTIGTVSPAALQRPCRWWINPAFLPKIMTIKDGNEKILKAPARVGDDWMLAGFPVTWTAAAPSTDSPASNVAAFGRGDAFTFAIARSFELRRSESGRGYNYNLSLVRATMRAQAKMRNAASFATLKTAAV